LDVESHFFKRWGLLVFGAMVEVVSAEILVEGSRLEHMVSGSEQGGGYGSDSFFGAAGGRAGGGIGPGSSCP
jgi:hypothetical protein